MNWLSSPSPQKELRYPGWQLAYEAAQQEHNIPALCRLVEIAEVAMLMRRDELPATAEGHDELHAINTALERLAVLKEERLNFPAHCGIGA